MEHILKLANSIGLNFTLYQADASAFQHFCMLAEYTERYSDYYVRNQLEKSFEHYIAFSLLEIQKDDIFIDAASEHSPVPEIFGRLSGATTYSQDIMYHPGIIGSTIGGDACAMPVPNSFASKIALTCSLEHFEGSADSDLFLEMARVLKPGGKVCVVPFYLFTDPAVRTDPTVSLPAKVIFDSDATVYCTKGWGNRHGRFYSPLSFKERIMDVCSDKFEFTFYHLANTDQIGKSIYARFAFTATRV